MIEQRDVLRKCAEWFRAGEYMFEAQVGLGGAEFAGREKAARYRTMAELCEAALSTPDLDGWQDISSAPKDGTLIWLFEQTATGPMHRAGYWEEHGEPLDDDGECAGWTPDGSGYIGEIEPTHWRPLPSPPNSDPSQ